MKAIDAIAAERERQQNVEGYTSQHDDSHSHGELAIAAACYAVQSLGPARSTPAQVVSWAGKPAWPFVEPMKPHGRRKSLIIAAAMLVAELERIDRIENSRELRDLNELVELKRMVIKIQARIDELSARLEHAEG